MKNISTRYDEAYILDARNGRRDSFSQWKSRIDDALALARGEWPAAAYSSGNEAISVMNIADVLPRDIARLACEVIPSFRASAMGDSAEAADNAIVRQIIAEGYFNHGRFDLMRPQLVMDMVVSGAAFVVYWTDSVSPYPRMMRVDPKGAFPDVYNGELQDLLVTSRMKVRVADRMWPDLNIRDRLGKFKDTEADKREVEILDYYAPDECVKYVGVIGVSGNAVTADLVSKWNPGLDRAPVSFAQLPSPDGAFRGMLDQVGPSLWSKNHAVNLMLEYVDQMVYAPWEHKGIINPTDLPGPDTLYAHDPSSTAETFMRRTPPAGSSPQVFGLVQFLDDEQHKQVALPASRQGDTGVSQGSAAYVQSTQGQLTSVVREVHRLLTDMQEQGTAVCMQLDENFLDFDKPLIRSIQRKKSYLPSRDIKGQYGVKVSYGAGAGLDRLNTDVRLLQFYSAGVLSAEKMLEETEFVADAPNEIDKREKEEIRRVILQRFAGDPTVSLDFIIRAYEIQKDQGISLVDAYIEAQKEMQAQPQPPEAGMPAGMPEQPAAQEPGEQQLALEKGETEAGGAPPIPGGFSPPPLQQVFVK